MILNITYHGQAGNYSLEIDPATDDATVKRVAEEAVRANEVPDISSDMPEGALANFVVDRFEDRFVVRPKVPFGVDMAKRFARLRMLRAISAR